MTRLDFETNVATGEPVVLTFRPEGEPVQVATGRERMAEVFARATAAGWAAHNAAFDAHVGARLIGDAPIWEAFEQGRILCTMIGATLRDIREDGETHHRGYALDAVAERLAVEVAPDKSNPWRMRYGELTGVPIEQWPREALVYLHDDVQAVDQILPRVENEKGIARESAHAWWLYPMGERGVRTDSARVAVLGERIERECAEAKAACGPVFRPDGSRDMKALHRVAADAGVTERTAPSARHPEGQLSVTQESIEGFDHPILSAYAQFLTLDAHRSRLLPQLRRERLTCRYKLAATGRAIASGGQGIDPITGKKITIGTNVQNLPKKGGWRECLIPDEPDHVWLVADFTGLELATFAEILEGTIGGSVLADSLRRGIDGHLAMAAQIAGCSFDAIVRAYSGELGPEARAYAAKMRQIAKGPNFGFPGGLGAGGFVAYMRGMGQRIELAEAARLRALWLASDPTYSEYLNRAGIAARLGEPLIGFRSGMVRSSTRYTEHANWPFQELGAYVAKLAGFRIARECAGGRLAGCRLAIFAHDEYVISAPRSSAADAAHVLETICSEVAAAVCTRVPLRAEPLLSDRWSKSAKPTRAPSGVLTVTEIP